MMMYYNFWIRNKFVRIILMKGKTLDGEYERHFVLSQEILELLKRKFRQNNKFAKEILDCVKLKNFSRLEELIFAPMVKIMKQVIEQHPEFITAEGTFIKVWFKELGRGQILNPGRFSAMILLEMDMDSVIDSLFTDVSELRSTFIHEFSHHLDHGAARIDDQLESTLTLKMERGEICKNVVVLHRIFFKLRDEGLATFTESFKMKKYVDIDWYFDNLDIFLQDISISVGRRTIKKLDTFVEDFEDLNYLGCFMVCIIILWELFLSNKQFSAWIKVRHWFGVKGKDISVVNLPQFFDKDEIRIIFTDKSVDPIVSAKLQDLRSKSHIEFIREYETACRYFKINDPRITLRYYSDWKKKSYINCQKYMNKIMKKGQIPKQQ